MADAEVGKAVQLLDLMLDYFAEDAHWTRGRYDDGHGGRCLVAALLHLSRTHRLPAAPAIALLQDAMPCPGLPLVFFNDVRCGGVAELRAVILKARRLADDHAERERAAAALKTWLLARIQKKRETTASADISAPLDQPQPSTASSRKPMITPSPLSGSPSPIKASPLSDAGIQVDSIRYSQGAAKIAALTP